MYVSSVQFFFNSYVYKRPADILRLLHIVNNSINEIIAFFSTVQMLVSPHCICRLPSYEIRP